MLWFVRSRYTARLDNFREAEYSADAVHCLNHLITNALAHIPDCLEVCAQQPQQPQQPTVSSS
jgi:hypothetical protein